MKKGLKAVFKVEAKSQKLPNKGNISEHKLHPKMLIQETERRAGGFLATPIMDYSLYNSFSRSFW